MLKLILFFAVLFIQDTEWNVSKKGVVAEGYDVVSYFDNEPKEGKETFVSEYKGATFYFSNAANKKKFDAKPAQYAPQYGGWCAYAMGSTGEKVTTNPETFTITDGKLYLFYNKFGTNTLEPWKENESELLKKSQINWQTKYQH